MKSLLIQYLRKMTLEEMLDRTFLKLQTFTDIGLIELKMREYNYLG